MPCSQHADGKSGLDLNCLVVFHIQKEGGGAEVYMQWMRRYCIFILV